MNFRLGKKLKNLIMAVVILAVFAAGIDSQSFVALAKKEAPVTSVIPGGPEIKAASAVVMDINSGAVLYAKNPTEAYQPSSLTKLLTSYVAYENLQSSDLINVSQTAAGISFPTAAEIGYTSGENICVQDAIKGMLLCSAEDCAYSLAERTSGTPEKFAELMNQAAKDLGFRNSHFVNPLGKYEENHYSCAYDMAKLAAELMKNNSSYASILSSKSTKLNATNNRNGQTITSTHRFMNDVDSCAHVYAAKTGGSAYGGNKTWALCTYASYKGLNVVCIIMDGPTNDSTYSDTKKLFNYIWDTYDSVASTTLINNTSKDLGAMFSALPMFDVTNKHSIYVDSDAVTSLPLNYDPELITSSVSYEQISDFLYGENVIGHISFYYNKNFCGISNIVFYTENVSMSATEFSRIFPSFLKTPSTNTITYVTGNTPKNGSKTLWGKIKAGVLSYYTPAKTFSFVLGLIVFVIGGLIILLTFPTHRKKKDTLYSSLYDNVSIDEYEGETGNLRRMRTSTDIDMQEIGSTSSYSDNRKKRNR